MDYRELNEKFDRIVSVGMFEHVGRKFYKIFFKKINNLMTEDGISLIHTIGSTDPKGPPQPFIQKYIFPGGFLPSINFMKTLIEKNQLNLLKVNSYPDDYAKTLATWRENFFKTWKNIVPLGFDETFKRMWEFYLSYCEAGFKARNINLIQCSMSNK